MLIFLSWLSVVSQGGRHETGPCDSWIFKVTVRNEQQILERTLPCMSKKVRIVNCVQLYRVPIDGLFTNNSCFVLTQGLPSRLGTVTLNYVCLRTSDTVWVLVVPTPGSVDIHTFRSVNQNYKKPILTLSVSLLTTIKVDSWFLSK